ncbi:Uncharacterised protein r2_g2279 [Pycnogonum litorale]
MHINDLPSLNDQCNLSLIHLNIRSLPKNYDKLVEFINIFKKPLDVICVSETWLPLDTDLKQYEIDEYDLITSPFSSRGRGSCLYISNNIPYKTRNIDYDMNICDCTCIEILQPKPLIIISVYRLHNSNISQFNLILDKILEDLNTSCKDIILCGDLNINLLKATEKTKDYLTTLDHYNLKSTITSSTRISNNSSTCIDHIFTNLDMFVRGGVIHYEISDHLPIFTIFEGIHKHFQLSNTVSVFNFKNYNKYSFRDDISKLDLNKSFLSSFAMYDYFLTNFSKVAYKHLPKVKLNPRKNTRKPYITQALRTSIINKHKMYSYMIKNPLDLTLKKNFITYRNKLDYLIKLSKAKYYHASLELAKSNGKKIWQIINSLTGLKRSTNNSPKLLNTDCGPISDPGQLASVFNNYFGSIGANLASLLPPMETIDDPCKFIKSNPHSLLLIPCSIPEMEKMLKSIDSSKAVGNDEHIHPALLKDSCDLIAPFLTRLFELIINTGEFPDKMKIAKVTPIYKSGDPTSTSNYRPISVLPPLSKIFEKLLLSRLSSFFDKYCLLNKNQFGFRRSLSTEHSLINVTEMLRNSIQKNSTAIGTFIDFSKAFDTINHNILIKKLWKYGVRDKALDLFKNYLSNRTQYVAVNKQTSDSIPINIGVPQGSILGPFLFLVYVNDLPLVCENSSVNMFADDTSLITTGPDKNTIESKLQNDLNNLIEWCILNKLTLNSKKTNYCVFAPNKKTKLNKFTFLINNNKIDRVKSVKFLGLTLDEDLNWKDHVKKLRSNLNKYIRLFYRIRSFMPMNLLRNLYFSYIHSHLTYANEVWGLASKTTLRTLQIIQKKFIRIITHSQPKDHTAPLFNKLNIQTMQEIHHFKICLLAYRILKERTTVYHAVDIQTTSNIHVHYTRNNNNNNLHVYTQRNNNTVAKYIEKYWNRLPHELQTSGNYLIFKINLKKYIKNLETVVN